METVKPKILLCEDDTNLGMVLKNYLELNDYDVTLERDGRLGLAAFQREKFDLCLLDVMMPHMDGFTVAEEIRDINPDVPLFFLSAKKIGPIIRVIKFDFKRVQMALSSFLSSFSAASRANRNLRLGLYLSNSSAIFSGGQASAEAIKLPSASRFPIILNPTYYLQIIPISVLIAFKHKTRFGFHT